MTTPAIPAEVLDAAVEAGSKVDAHDVAGATEFTLCRTCLRPITFETRTEPGYLPREGWYDDARTDPFVCFKARRYRHEPLTDRERAYFDAGVRHAMATAGDQR